MALIGLLDNLLHLVTAEEHVRCGLRSGRI
jgi:hypothetical protein